MTIKDRVLAYNVDYVTESDRATIENGTEGVSVTVAIQRKDSTYRVVAIPGVRATDGAFWPCSSPSVFYAKPTRNYGQREMARHYAGVMSQLFETELPLV